MVKSSWLILLVTGFVSVSYHSEEWRQEDIKLEIPKADSQSNFHIYTIQLEPFTVYRQIQLPFQFSSFTVVSDEWTDLSGVKVSIGDKEGEPIGFLEGREGSAVKHSNLFMATPVDSIIGIQGDARAHTIVFHFYYAPKVEVQRKRSKKSNLPCEVPEAITQDEWRDGLPDPVEGRDTHAVKHVIVHHSAGSNQRTDYVNVVRNIYLLHTQTNGWDDIGYNYLIAGDGTLFLGRDPLGSGDQDNIQGAHYCGKNTGTMGVCLLGTWSNTLPSDTARAVLERLLAWKCQKDQLSAVGSHRHPSTSSPFLPVIAGHRQGCSTECPGERFYTYLDTLKSNVLERMKLCETVGIRKRYSGAGLLLYPNPSTGVFKVQMVDWKEGEFTYQFFDLNGREVLSGEVLQRTVVRHRLPSGNYTFVLKGKGYPVASRRLIVP